MKRRFFMLFCAMFALATACSDALVDGTYRGEPLLRLHGDVRIGLSGTTSGMDPMGPAAQMALPKGMLRLAFLWAHLAGAGGGAGMTTMEQQALTTAEFPAQYSVALFSPPPAHMLVPESDGSGSYGIGLLVVYIDANNDGRWTANTDPLVGGALDHAIVYTPGGTTGAALGVLDPGYHLTHTTGTCGGTKPLTFAEDEDLAVDLRISESMPSGVLLDLNCDGKASEWETACPTADHLATMCAKDAQGWPCGLCPR